MEYEDKYGINPIIDKNGNAKLIITDENGNVLFDQFGITARGRKIIEKDNETSGRS